MKAVLLLVLLGVALASAYTEAEYMNAFTAWMQEYKVTYTAAEFQDRFAIFKTNMDYVRDWNSQGTDTVLGLNIMADLTNEEYQALYLGTKIDGTLRLARAPPKTAIPMDTYNNTVDWRNKGIVTPIKDQGECGSCWSFSTTGSVEGAHAQATGELVSLSEQNLIDCSTSFGNQGCDGGLMDYAFQYIIKNQGIDTEASYPYEADQGTCHYNPSNSGATISSYQDVTSGSEPDLQIAATQQPVSVAIDASGISFQLYKSGVYHDYLCSSTKLDHGVLVVGYGVEDTFLTTKKYWIVKNSWGTDWGMDGYIYMSRDRDNNCGIATAASYPIV